MDWKIFEITAIPLPETAACEAFVVNILWFMISWNVTVKKVCAFMKSI